jgi:hypothetical protein
VHIFLGRCNTHGGVIDGTDLIESVQFALLLDGARLLKVIGFNVKGELINDLDFLDPFIRVPLSFHKIEISLQVLNLYLHVTLFILLFPHV